MRALRRERERAPRTQGGKTGRPVLVSLHRSELVVVEAGAPEAAVVHRKAQRFDEVEPAAGVRREPDDVAGVGRDLRLHEDDVEHQAGGSVRATTQFTTLAAPARFSVSASSSRVAPVVMTSSTTATVAPVSARLQPNAPRTLRRRSSHGSSVCATASAWRTHTSMSSFPRARCRAISTAWL